MLMLCLLGYVRVNDLKQILGIMAADHTADKCISDHIEEFHGTKVVALNKAVSKGTNTLVKALDEARTELGVPSKPIESIGTWANRDRLSEPGKTWDSLRWGQGGFHWSECVRKFIRLPRPGQASNAAPRALRGMVQTARELGRSPAVFLMPGKKPRVLAVCTTCSAYTMDQCRNMGTTCSMKHGTNCNTMKRLSKGLHPTCEGSKVLRCLHWKSAIWLSLTTEG
jgi:hypothetical protein